MVDQRNEPSFLHRMLHRLVVIIKAYFMSVGVFVTVAPLITILIVSQLAKQHREEPLRALIGDQEKVVLHLKLHGELTEATPETAELMIGRLFEDRRFIDRHEIDRGLRRAARDDRVKGVLVELVELKTSLAGYSDLRRSLDRFRSESGKPVTFAISSADTSTYYLASVANHIALVPQGSLELTGPSFQLVYFAGALNKLGIHFDVIKAGKYKSAMEPLVANEPSIATREMYESMEKSLREHYVAAIAESRGRKPEEVAAWFAESIFTAKDGLERGMVDSLRFFVDVKDGTKKELGADSVLRLGDYVEATAALDKPLVADSDDEIGLIELVGEIAMDPLGRSPRDVTPMPAIAELKWARERKEVKAVVLRVSSPGGSALASDLIWEEVRKLAEAKPVVVSMGEYAASGGYYISVPARKIIAEPTTITGSIGVISAVPKLTSFPEKYGVSFHLVSESKRRGLLNLGSEATAEDRALLARSVDFVYQAFLEKVAAGRNMPVERVAALAEGRVYTGGEALALGLVDELGGISEAYRSAKELAGLDPAKLYAVSTYEPEQPSLAECLGSAKSLLDCVGSLGGATTRAGQSLARQLSEGGAVAPALEPIMGRLAGLEQLLRGGEPLALWPGYVGFAVK